MNLSNKNMSVFEIGVVQMGHSRVNSRAAVRQVIDKPSRQ